MYAMISLRALCLSIVQACNAAKVRRSSSALPSGSLDSRCCAISTSSRTLPEGHRRRKNQTKEKSTAIVFISAYFLTAGWAESERLEPLTQRDLELKKILRATSDVNEQSLLSERVAQLNELRRAYSQRLSMPENLFQTRMSYVTGKGNREELFGGFKASLRHILQFSENLQSDMQISLARDLYGTTPFHPLLDSELPTLDHLEVSYGRHRSTEMLLGMPADAPLLTGTSGKPIFSGFLIAIHPLKQQVKSEGTLYQMDFEHGWTNLLAENNSSSQRIKLQRTRPRLYVRYNAKNAHILAATGLEWYSDSRDMAGRIAASRPFAAAETQTASEKNWRLFSLTSRAEMIFANELKTTLAFERVSNTLGKTANPATSTVASISYPIAFSDASWNAIGSVQAFSSPHNALPAFRLPLEISPGSEGILAKAGVMTRERPESKAELQLTINFLKKRQSTPPLESTCKMAPLVAGQSCSELWLGIAWSLKSPTNL